MGTRSEVAREDAPIPADDGRRYRLITAPQALKTGDVVLLAPYFKTRGTVLHNMEPGTIAFVQTAGPSEETD